MGKTDNTSKSGQGRDRAPTAQEQAAPQPPTADPFLKDSLDLMVAIEVERARLMKAESLLHCAILAMDYDGGFDDGERPYYPNVIEVARDLVNQVLSQLDSTKLGPMIEKLHGRAGLHAETPTGEHGSDPEGVKELHAAYRLN